MSQENELKTTGSGSGKPFNRKEWKEKHKNAKTQDEIMAMINDLPTSAPHYNPTDTIEFTDLQIAELRAAALSFSESWRLDELPWDDAWSGKFPRVSTEEEIDEVFTLMKEDAIRILKFGYSDDDYSTEEKRCRMICLEGCKSLELWCWR